MLNYSRPSKPGNFQQKSNVERTKVELELTSSPDKLSFNSSFWGKYKSHFMKAQHSKCGYCEVTNSSWGDVEHYRPKSVVEELKSAGAERPNLHTVLGRKFKKSCQYGYWWLAYDWNNYLLSCTLCNQPWKRALFPIAETRAINPDPGSDYPKKSPTSDDNETALLLNPYENTVLSQHIDYSTTGLIKPYNSSEHGRQTIITCGLDRPSLNQKRARKAQRTMRLINRFADAEEGSSRELEIAQDLLDSGDERDDFAGMVRILFERYAGGFSWCDLCEFVEGNAI